MASSIAQETLGKLGPVVKDVDLTRKKGVNEQPFWSSAVLVIAGKPRHQLQTSLEALFEGLGLAVAPA